MKYVILFSRLRSEIRPFKRLINSLWTPFSIYYTDLICSMMAFKAFLKVPYYHTIITLLHKE